MRSGTNADTVREQSDNITESKIYIMPKKMTQSEIKNHIERLEAVEAKYQHLYDTFEDHDDWVWFIGERMAEE